MKHTQTNYTISCDNTTGISGGSFTNPNTHTISQHTDPILIAKKDCLETNVVNALKMLTESLIGILGTERAQQIIDTLEDKE